MNARTLAALALLFLAALPVAAQDALQIVRSAVQSELAANKADDTHWRFRDEERHLGTVSIVVETPQGAVKQAISRNGQPLTPAQRSEATASVDEFIHDPSLQRKQRRDAANDDKQAAELLNILPRAFLWTIRSDTAETVTLDYKPDPAFHPSDMEARVMSAMTGELVVDKQQHRIRTIRGHLTDDVTIGWGMLGRLKSGGTFDVERRQVAPGKWQITATSVHINGHALFFKNISEQQDEVKSGFVEVPNSTTLEQAAAMLQDAVNKEH